MPFSSIGQKNCELRSVMTWGIYSSLSREVIENDEKFHFSWQLIKFTFHATFFVRLLLTTSLIHCWSSSDQGLVYYHFYLSLVCCYCTIKCKQSSLSLMMANRHLISKTFLFDAPTHSLYDFWLSDCYTIWFIKYIFIQDQ